MSKHCCLVMVIWILSSLCCDAANFAGGTGSAEDPYQIATAEQLLSIGADRNLLDKHFALVADIFFDPNRSGRSAITWAPIAPHRGTSGGGVGFVGTSFTGVFDGRGYIISGMNINVGLNANRYLGLFGQIGEDGIVKRVGIANARISAEQGVDYAGGLVGMNRGLVEQCFAQAELSVL